MFCSRCGVEKQGSKRYCGGCGIEFSESEPDNALADSTSPNETDSSRSFLSRTKSIVNKIIAGCGILLLAILLVLGLAIFADDCRSSTSIAQDVLSGKATPRPSVPTPTPVGYVDLREMLDLYGANRAAADHRYKGERVVIDGTIHGDITKKYFDIIPRESDLFQMSGARCFYHPNRFNDVMDLRKDQYIEFRGIQDGLDPDLFLTIIRVVDCDF